MDRPNVALITLMDLPYYIYEPIVRMALNEDIGPGDITTNLCIPDGYQACAIVYAKTPGVIAGLSVGATAFRLLDPAINWEPLVSDGARVDERKTAIARVSGNARAILTAERVALNFMQQMSGVATTTARFVSLVKGTNARIVDTRKTTPGLRVLEKYSVCVGGGYNHRLGLYDAVLIKDNHIRAAGGIKPAVERAIDKTGHTVKVEVETTNLDEVKEALDAGADIIMLDNMTNNTMAQAVKYIDKRAITEASGGVNETTVAAIAATGVDIISIGALTHSTQAMDISLDFLHD